MSPTLDSWVGTRTGSGSSGSGVEDPVSRRGSVAGRSEKEEGGRTDSVWTRKSVSRILHLKHLIFPSHSVYLS